MSFFILVNVVLGLKISDSSLYIFSSVFLLKLPFYSFLEYPLLLLECFHNGCCRVFVRRFWCVSAGPGSCSCLFPHALRIPWFFVYWWNLGHSMGILNDTQVTFKFCQCGYFLGNWSPGFRLLLTVPGCWLWWQFRVFTSWWISCTVNTWSQFGTWATAYPEFKAQKSLSCCLGLCAWMGDPRK